jgi:tRNA pseudouridine55 synthase
LNGILLLDKPEGLTSAAVVRRVRDTVGRDIRVGHLGTLDPFATGLLPICIGEGTKIAQFLNDSDKVYEGLIRLGESTDSGDRTGAVIDRRQVPTMGPETLDAIARRLTGGRLQLPPMYSAVKHGGIPLYRLARRGITVTRQARQIWIYELTLGAAEREQLRFRVECSKGTYVRVLAEDVGRAIGVPAHLSELRRTRFGAFSIDQAITLDSWARSPADGVVDIRTALAHLPVTTLPEEVVVAARRGSLGPLARLSPSDDGARLVLLDAAQSVVAIAECRGSRWRYARVLGSIQGLYSPESRC